MNVQAKNQGDERRQHQERTQQIFDLARKLIPIESNEQVWKLCDLCARYGLDPVTGDIAFLKGVPYVTFRGMTRLAHASGLYEGVTLEIMHQDHEKGEYLVKAMVYKMGCQYPFEDFGDGETNNRQVGKLGKIKIATTRAKCRALRSAFPVVLPVEGDSEAEMIDQFNRVSSAPVSGTNNPPGQAQKPAPSRPAQERKPEGNQQQTQAQPPKVDSQDEWKQARARLKEFCEGSKISKDDLIKKATELFGKVSSQDMTAKEIDSLIAVLKEEKKMNQF